MVAQRDDGCPRVPEHSGSFVDARTGQPYDDSYGQRFRQLAALDSLSSQSSAEEDEGWREKSQETMAKIRESISDGSSSAKQRLAAIGGHLSELGLQSRSYAAKYGKAARRSSRSAMRSSRRGVQQTGQQLQHGYETTRDFVTEAAEENPLAVGLGVLGLGLLVGSMLPNTQREDEAFGEQADAVKQRGTEAGREALHRGEDVARSAGQAAFEEAEQQGLTPSQVAEQTREAANRTVEAVKQEAASPSDLRSRVESVAEKTKEAAKDEMHEQKEQAKENHASSSHSP